MLDPLERLEVAAEAQYERVTKGLPEGRFRCGCGRITDLNDAHPWSDNPYAMPTCGECLDEAIRDKERCE